MFVNECVVTDGARTFSAPARSVADDVFATAGRQTLYVLWALRDYMLGRSTTGALRLRSLGRAATESCRQVYLLIAVSSNQ